MNYKIAYKRLIDNDDFILSALDRQARELSGKIYIYYGEDNVSFTFLEFKQITDRIAAGLLAQGVIPGKPVNVLTRNSLLSVLSMYAIWRAGGVFAPINFNFTNELIANQIQDTGPCVIITDNEFLPSVAAVLDELPKIRLIVHYPKLGDHDYKIKSDRVEEEQNPEIIDFSTLQECEDPLPKYSRSIFDDANIVYTSGTTGNSKGVIQAFRWMSYYAQLQYTGYTEEDVLYCDLPMYHVAGAFALTTRALWAGCTIGIWDRFSLSKFWSRVHNISATNAILMDVVITRLMNEPERETDKNNTLNKVHMQPLPRNHNDIARRFGFDIVTCGYGQTESGSAFFAVIDELGDVVGTPERLWRGLPKNDYIKMCREAGAAVRRGDEALPEGFMGKPNPLLEVAVLDNNDNQCKLGEIGELCYRPRYPGLLFKGYLNNPAATVDVLTNCWYHTGDAGYEDNECPGTYVFVDRIGGFFRVRGENVSSFEVESLVGTYPDILNCAAVAVPAEEGYEDDIAVFIQVKEHRRLDLREIRSYLERSMPRYMMPKYLKVIEKMPTTPTNKIEKYKLREMLMRELGI